MDWENEFQYRGERYRKKYLDAVQELYQSAEFANSAIGEEDTLRWHTQRENPANRKFGGKDGD